MGAMHRAVLLALVLLPAGLTVSKSNSTPRSQQASNKSEVDRGRYLVEEVARCQECHTPRNAQGELDRNAWLQGASIWIMPVRPNPHWAERAPALAGFPSYTEKQGERILEEGTGPEGENLHPPMHTYHLAHEDAKAILAYLRSLPLAKRPF